MSQPLIAARKAPVRAREARPDTGSRPELQVVVPPAVRRLRLPLPVACVVLLSLGLFGLLMTNIAIAGDAYRITDLRVTSERLADQQQAAQESLAAQSAPQALASRAAELGMVPAPAPVHLTADGAVGTPTAAPTPAQEPSAQGTSAQTAQDPAVGDGASGPAEPAGTASPEASPEASATTR
ncbi:septum formation initiator [Kineococcus auxinigenes]|uniref:septum formation initiator n=1 Tax=unclassified Kineococcus TaxID=2621656 RepID=UPI003D7E976D